MKQIVQFEMPESSPIFIEVEEAGKYGALQPVSRTSEGVLKAEKTFMKGISLVKPAAEAVLKAFREMNTPDEINLEFGLKFSAKAGAVLASVYSQATFKVYLRWKEKGFA